MALNDHDRRNFDILSAAFRNGDVALMECQRADTQQRVAVICAVHAEADGGIGMVPFAQMFSEDPYSQINPPHPEHDGFVTQDQS